MKFIIRGESDIPGRYFLTVKSTSIYPDDQMSAFFKMSFKDYVDILIQCGAYYERMEYYFYNKEDTEKAIKLLEAYLILERLCE